MATSRQWGVPRTAPLSELSVCTPVLSCVGGLATSHGPLRVFILRAAAAFRAAFLGLAEAAGPPGVGSVLMGLAWLQQEAP